MSFRVFGLFAALAVSSMPNVFSSAYAQVSSSITKKDKMPEATPQLKEQSKSLARPSQNDKTDKDLPSPYFVVGFLCEGLPEVSASTSLLFGKEFSERLYKEQLTSACDRNFESLGIEKYTWVSGQDLERVDFLLNSKNRFQKHRIEILAAEAPGHVYLKLILDPKGTKKLIAELETSVGFGPKGLKPEKIAGFGLSGRLAQQTSNLGPFRTTTFGVDYSIIRQNPAVHSDYSVSGWMSAGTQITKDWRALSRVSLNVAKVWDKHDSHFFGTVGFMGNLFHAANLAKVEVGPALGYYAKQFMGGAHLLMTMESDPLSRYFFELEYLNSLKDAKQRTAVSWDYQNRVFGSEHFYFGIGTSFVSSSTGTWNDLKPSSGEEETYFEFSDHGPDVTNGLRLGYAFASGEDLHQVAMRLKGLGSNTSKNLFYNIGLDYIKNTADLDLKLGIEFSNGGSPSVRLPM